MTALPEVFNLSKDVTVTVDDGDQIFVNEADVANMNKGMRNAFDLAQMIVLNENGASNEYLDMELMEFLEFLVRISFMSAINSDMEGKHIAHKVKWVLVPLLDLVGRTYVEVDIDASLTK